VAVAGFLLAASAASLFLFGPSLSPRAPGPATPADYPSLCIEALARLQRATHRLGHAEIAAADPVVASPGAPLRLACGVREGAHAGVLAFDAACWDWQQEACVRLRSATMDRRVVFPARIRPAARPGKSG
jgi:hypothetical protein